MKVLVLGNGAREHALAWKFSTSNRISGLFVAPGNAGTAEVAKNLPDVDPYKPETVIQACQTHGINLVFVGPEAYLDAGIADALQAAHIPVVGPNKYCAQLESSKAFSKDFMVRNHLPTAQAKEFNDYAPFEKYINSTTGKVVVKKSGLAQGKGVLETADKKEALDFGMEILKDDKLLVEEFLTGFEISVFVLLDGKDYVVLPPTADFKKAQENDKGPNTGGMGAICPVPSVDAKLWASVQSDIVAPTVAALNKDNLNYKGILFIGLMITEKGPMILEFNVRFGDPETQVLLPLIKSDFADLAQSMAEGTLKDYKFVVAQQVALGVVIAAPGYPATYPKGLQVQDLPAARPDKFQLFHASTGSQNNKVLTQGGRCFTCVGVGDNFADAKRRAYKGAAEVKFDGAWFRKDIGEKFFQ